MNLNYCDLIIIWKIHPLTDSHKLRIICKHNGFLLPWGKYSITTALFAGRTLKSDIPVSWMPMSSGNDELNCLNLQTFVIAWHLRLHLNTHKQSCDYTGHSSHWTRLPQNTPQTGHSLHRHLRLLLNTHKHSCDYSHTWTFQPALVLFLVQLCFTSYFSFIIYDSDIRSVVALILVGFCFI